MDNRMIYIPTAINKTAIRKTIAPLKHIAWTLHPYVEEGFGKYHAVSVTDCDDMRSIIDLLEKENIPTFLSPPPLSKRLYNILFNEKEENKEPYENILKETLYDITYDFVDKLANLGYAKDGSQPTLTAEEREKLTQTILKTAIESMPRKFPTIN